MGTSVLSPRINPEAGIWREFLEIVESRGLNPDEVLTALIAGFSGRTGERWEEIKDVVLDLTPTTQAEFSQMLDAVFAEHAQRPEVAFIRLGAREESDSSMLPFTREYHGADVLESDCATLWGAARGAWSIGDRSRYIVASRVGVPLMLFGGISWSKRDPSLDNRRWAIEGYAVVDGRRLDPESGRDVGEASWMDEQVEQVLHGRRLVMPRGASNPVAYI